MSLHLTPEQVEQYVIGSLADGDVRAVEHHVDACQPCQQLLMREARLEVQLLELAEHVPAPSATVLKLPVRPRISAAAMAIGGLIAAGLVVFFAHEPPQRAGEGPRIAHCTNPSSAADCIAQGEFDGVITIGPNQQLIVPRYDVSPTRTP